MMDPGRLRYFPATADDLSFRPTAAIIGVNQSALSRHIAALEDEPGVTLFERTSTGPRLTEVGRMFLADARRIIAEADRARERIVALACGPQGRPRLAVCEDATRPTCAAILAALAG